MSFTRDVKEELCERVHEKNCCALAELYGVFLFSNRFIPDEIKIVTESRSFTQRVAGLLKLVFGFDFDLTVSSENLRDKNILVISDTDKLKTIFSAFGRSMDGELSIHLNLGVFEEECCYRAFLRGAFLSGGSVMNPEKKYHLEITTPHSSLSRETCAVIRDIDLIPKISVRKANYVIYFKASEAIEDFLSMTGAQLSAIKLMETKVEKDFRNRINRNVNCETANLTKTVDASREQCIAVEKIKAHTGLDKLPEKLKQAAELRLKSPEASLAELAKMMYPPVGKSGINHRMRKLIEISEAIDAVSPKGEKKG